MRNIIREHILVCLSSAPSNANTIRAAAKLSQAFGGTMTALYVQTKRSDQMGAEDRQRLQRHARLAEKLGASVSTVTGDDVAFQIAEFARISKATKVVLGRSAVPKGRLFAPKPLTEQLVELAPYLDVYIIPDSAGKNKRKQNPATKQRILPSIRDMLITIGILALSTVIGFAFHRLRFTEANTITVYILGVLITAVWTNGHFYGAIDSLLSVAAFNFLFTEPRFTFQANDPSYPVTFLIMLFSSVIVSSLASRVKAQARLAAQKSYYTELLLGSSQKLQKGRTEWDCLRLTAEQLNRLFDRPVLYALSGTEKELAFRVEPSDEQNILMELGPEEIGVAKWVQRNNKHAGATTNTLPDSKWLFLSVRGTQGVMGIVGIPIAGYSIPDAFEKNLMIAILSECGLSQERIRMQEERNKAAFQAQKERLQANLLRAVSHDLRTPLTNISGSADMLMQEESALDPAIRKKLYTAIYDDTNWLINMTENLLVATHLETDKESFKISPELIEDLFQSVVAHLDRRAAEHHISVHLEDVTLMAAMNARLIQRVIINIMNNAIQYTPKESNIELSAVKKGNAVQISVTDDGPGIPNDAKRHLFDSFYTAGQGKADCQRGLGLGLNLCQSIVAMHGGKIDVLDHMPTGTIFQFTLPLVSAEEVKY